jgi:hypothetical protein
MDKSANWCYQTNTNVDFNQLDDKTKKKFTIIKGIVDEKKLILTLKAFRNRKH